MEICIELDICIESVLKDDKDFARAVTNLEVCFKINFSFCHPKRIKARVTDRYIHTSFYGQKTLAEYTKII